MASLEELREAINDSPKLHEPCCYKVGMSLTKRNKSTLEHYRYVRASSERRAKLVATLVDREYGYKKTFASSVTRETKGVTWL